MINVLLEFGDDHQEFGEVGLDVMQDGLSSGIAKLESWALLVVSLRKPMVRPAPKKF